MDGHTIVGISLVVAGIVGNFAGFLSYSTAEAEVIERRPELAPLQDEWDRFKRLVEVHKAYRAEFPSGWKLRLYWILTAVAIISFFSGIAMLIEFK